MKRFIIFAGICLFIHACTSKKTEGTGNADSLAMDSSILADRPAPSALSFSPIEGFSLNNKLTFTDSTNYFIFFNQEELNEKFVTDAKTGSTVMQPDFLINYVVAVAMSPTQDLVTILLDKVQINDRDIDVYLTIQHGAKQTTVTKPSRIFAIEKRNGYVGMQFYVNGKKDKAFILPME
jgi:hypothetical protein